MAEFQEFEQQDSPINLQKLLGKVISKWYLIAISLFLALGVTYFIHRYATEIFQSSVIIRNKELGNWSDRSNKGVEQLPDGNDYFSPGRNAKEEIEILSSSTVLSDVLDKLDFSIAYYRKGNVKSTELYSSIPFRVYWDSSYRIPYQVPFELFVIDEEHYSLSTENKELEPSLQNREFTFGNWHEIDGSRLRVTIGNTEIVQKEYEFVAYSQPQLVRQYRSKLRLREETKSIFSVTMTGPTPEKDVAFLNAFVNTIIENNLQEKNQIATNTITFINEQLGILYDSLRYSQSILGNINLNQRELAMGSDLLLGEMDQKLDELADLQINQRYTEYLEDYIANLPEEEIVVPSTLGIKSPTLSSLVENSLQSGLDQQQMDLDTTLYNPALEMELSRNERELEVVRKAMLESVRKVKQANQFTIDQARSEIEELRSAAAQVLDQEWDFIYRQKILEFNQQLYNLLLERRIEASIARASTTSDYQVLQGPSFRSNPIAPDKGRNYTIALFLGLALPIGLIVGGEFMNRTVADLDVLKQVTQIPFLGLVGHNKDKSNLVLFDKPKSIIAEAFRSIRSNIKFFGATGEQRIFLITSSISNEGKTFCSINLSSVFSFSQKKTLLIGADLRKPKIYTDFGLHNDAGLTSFLVGSSTLEEVIQTTHYQYLDIMSAGPIPPNPSELLMSERMSELLDILKEQYEYIIIDSPPLGIVTDASILMNHVDQTVFIVRQNFTPKQTLRSIDNMYQAGKVKDVSIIFNDVKMQRFGYYQYGYGYGYGYAYEYGSNGYYVDKSSESKGAVGRLKRLLGLK